MHTDNDKLCVIEKLKGYNLELGIGKGLSEDMTFKFRLEGKAWQRLLYT